MTARQLSEMINDSVFSEAEDMEGALHGHNVVCFRTKDMIQLIRWCAAHPIAAAVLAEECTETHRG